MIFNNTKTTVRHSPHHCTNGCSLKDVSSLKRIAMNSETDFFKWLKSSNLKKSLDGVPSPFVIDTLRFLVGIKESHPDGISKPKFVRYFVGTNNSKYLSTILSMAEVYKKNGSNVLSPFSEIFNHTDVFESVGEVDTVPIVNTLGAIEKNFNDYLSSATKKSPTNTNQQTNTNKQLTRKNKKKGLFFYLIDELSQKIASVLDSGSLDDVANEIRSDRMMLIDFKALKKARLTDTLNYDRSYMLMHAQEVASTILKRTDPQDYEYNYNYLVNSGMRFNINMSDEDFEQYLNEIMLMKGRGEESPIPRVNFPAREWIHPTFIEFIAFTLKIISGKVL